MENPFEVVHSDKNSNARTGVLHLPHGDVATPVFMPVGTKGAVKAVTVDALREIGFQIILSNTYHLYLRPGPDLIKSAGGLHGFTAWSRNFLTDSGGFQVFSLKGLRKVSDEGVLFQSHIDGSRHLFTAESVVEAQLSYNSDIQMALDVCSPYGASYEETKEALRLTSAWAARAKIAWEEALQENIDYFSAKASFNNSNESEGGKNGAKEQLFNSGTDACGSFPSANLLFPIVQGGFFRNLRRESALFTANLGLPGVAIGGLSVGESANEFIDFVNYTVDLLPRDSVKYVMGIGTPRYLLEAIAAGVDMADCVLPTRNARNGSYFTHDGMISIKQARYKNDFTPLDSQCSCPVCRKYSRAYLHHLFREGEILCAMAGSYHNLYFLHNLIKEARAAIECDNFLSFKDNFLQRFYKNGV